MRVLKQISLSEISDTITIVSNSILDCQSVSIRHSFVGDMLFVTCTAEMFGYIYYGYIVLTR